MEKPNQHRVIENEAEGKCMSNKDQKDLQISDLLNRDQNDDLIETHWREVNDG